MTLRRPRESLLSVLLAILLLSSTVTPVLGHDVSTPETHQTVSLGVDSEDELPPATGLDVFATRNRSTPRQHRLAAVTAAQQLSGASVSARINRSQSAYLDDTRVATRQVFTRDADVLRRLARTADLSPTVVATIREQLFAADAATANASVTDARRVLEETDRIDEETRTTARGRLEEAETALQTATHYLATNETDDLRAHAAAVRQYGKAWRYSQQALDRLDEAVEPQITLDRRDPVRNGTTTTDLRITGTVSDIRTRTLDRVVLWFDGTETTTSADLVRSPVPGSNATFSARINVTDRITTINVRAVSRADFTRNESCADGLCVDQVVHTTTALNVRSGPGLEHDVIETVDPKTPGTIIGGPVRTAATTWFKVDYNGVTGWSAAAWLTRGWCGKFCHDEAVYTNTRTVVRSGPSETAEPVANISHVTNGTIVEGPTEAEGTRWWRVAYENGTVGWSPRAVLEPGTCEVACVGSTAHTIAPLNVRSAPGVDQPIIETQAPKSEGSIIAGPAQATNYTWWKLTYDDGTTGWSAGAWLNPGGCVSLCHGDDVQTTDPLKVRSRPTLSATRVTTMPAGANGTIVSAHEHADGFVWWKVAYEDGPTAWSVEQYLADPTPPDSTVRVVDEVVSGHTLADGPPSAQSVTRPGANETEGVVQQTAEATLLLDGDALPGRYEQRVLGTDPRDPDSETPKAEGSAADDGTIDGREDFDQDGAITYLEYEAGADPFTVDTDGDGLTDAEELRASSPFDPTKTDTNGDGIEDGAGDYDDDGLTNREEYDAGTRPIVADTDGDGLDDAAELDNGTDPTVRDSDGDTILDGEELAIDTDPLSADTDGDGTTDANETVVTSRTDADTGAMVNGTATGRSLKGLSVEDAGLRNATNISASPGVRVTNRSAVQNLSVTLPVAGGAGTNVSTASHGRPSEHDPEDLALYAWNGSARQNWHVMDETVNVENGQVRTTVEQAGYYAVFNRTAWQQSLRVDQKTPVNFQNENTSCERGQCQINGDDIVLNGSETAASAQAQQHTTATDDDDPRADGQSGVEPDSPPYTASELEHGPVHFNSSQVSPQSTGGETSSSAPGVGSTSAWTRSSFYNRSFPYNTGDITFEALIDRIYAEADSGARITAVSEDETEIIYELTPTDEYTEITDKSVSEDISEFEGEDVTFYLEVKPGSGVALDGWEVDIEPPDDDGDGIPNGPDECPQEYGTVGDGCPDSDGDSVHDGEDACEDTYGVQPNGCPYSSQLDWQTSLPATAETLELRTSYSLSGADNKGWLVVHGKRDRKRIKLTDRNGYRKLDISNFAGETLRVVLATGGETRLNFESVRVVADSDGDGLYDHQERQRLRMPTGNAGTFTLDPFDPDTDNDGLLDGEEVTLEGEGADTEVKSARSNPARADTDGDGLTDYREVRESPWTVDLLTSHEDAQAFQKALRTGEEAPGRYVSSVPVSGAPLVADRDNDGLDDGREFQLGTRPGVRDSDGDGIDDDEDVDQQTDPTRFDTTGPEIEIRESEYIDGDILGFIPDGGKFTVAVWAEDPSGVERYTLRFDGEDRETVELAGTPEEPVFEDSVEIGVIKEVLSGLQTNRLKVRVADVHGNERTKLAYTDRNFVVEKVEELGALEDLSSGDVYALGILTGISGSAGQFAGTIRKALLEPREFLSQLTDLQQYIRLARNIEQVPGLLAQSFERQQQLSNPYYDAQENRETDSLRYEQFRQGYYGGLVVFEVALGAAGAGAADKLSDINKVQEIASKQRVAKALSAYRQASRYAPSALAARSARRVASTVVDNSQIARRVVSGAKTVGRQFRVAKNLRRVDSDTLSSLDDVSRQNAIEFLQRTDKDGVELINDLDDETTRDFFRLGCSPVRGAVASRVNGGAAVGTDSVEITAGCPDGAPDAPHADVADQVNYLSENVDGFTDEDRVALTEVYTNLDRSRDGGLTTEEIDKLGEAFETADDVDVGPGSDPSDVVANLKYLSEEGVDDFVDAGGSASSRYKGVAGETDIARGLLENTDLNADDINLGREAPVDGGPNTRTEYDVEATSDGDNAGISINGEYADESGTLLNSPAFESKHLNPASYDPDGFPKPGEEADKLVKKLTTQVADGEGELVVVTTQRYLDEYGDDYLESVQQRVRNRVDAGSNIEIDGDDVTVRITTYDNIR